MSKEEKKDLYEKLSDSEYSFFDEMCEKDQRRLRKITLIVTSISIAFAVIMISFAISTGFYFLIGILALFSPYAILFNLLYLAGKRNITKVKKILHERNIDHLLEMAHSSNTVAMYALTEIGEERAEDIIRFYDTSAKYSMSGKKYHYLREVYAIRRGFNSYNEFLLSLVDDDQPTEEMIIPITKVYFTKEIPKKTKCMVSGLILNVKNDNIVICPFCGNMAKQKLLFSWLETKKSCPVCQKTLTIDEIPLVKIGQ